MKIAIVGTGAVAARHLGVLAQIAGLELVGHLSAEYARAEAQARCWGGRAHATLISLVERERPDAVWICVTPDRHGALEEGLIERGIPFFVEKPLAADLETAERIGALLAARPVIAGVGYKFRALETLPLAQAMLAERPARMVLGAWHDATPAVAWWRDRRRSGGQIVEQATHLVDLARLLAGEPEVLGAVGRYWPRAGDPACGVEQVSAALLRFPGGVPGTLTATCLLEGRQAIQLQVICDGRVLTVSDRELRIETGRETRVIPVIEDPFLREDEGFVRAVREGEPRHLFSGYADALRTHRLCIAIHGAARATDNTSEDGERR